MSKDELNFFFYLDTIEEKKSVESAVDDFASFLLDLLGFTSRDLFIRQRPALNFKAGRSFKLHY